MLADIFDNKVRFNPILVVGKRPVRFVQIRSTWPRLFKKTFYEKLTVTILNWWKDVPPCVMAWRDKL